MNFFENESFNSIEETVMKVVGDHLGIAGSTLSLEMYLTEDLGADSLDRLELIMTVEELFKIVIPEKALPNIQRINDIVTVIKNTVPTRIKVESFKEDNV